jgi:hypothetical protein
MRVNAAYIIAELFLKKLVLLSEVCPNAGPGRNESIMAADRK